MSENEEFDYQAYTREHPPDPSKIYRGIHARKLRIRKKMEELGRQTKIKETLEAEEEQNKTLRNPT